jgi:D-alanyl-D-alanine carboxypeptidase (penicillin-binding protein 5/6)
VAPSAPAAALSLYDQPKYAAILVDAKTGEVLYSRRADLPRHPASITKVMTLFLAFDALEKGELKLDERLTVSARAAGQAPSRIGFRAGDTIRVEDAIRALAVKSANDVSVVLAERLGGTEANFAEMMTKRARKLGMLNTNFANASGLPNPAHSTTARDIAILSMQMIKTHPQKYRYFGEQRFAYGSTVHNNHNHLLGKLLGVDGIKTGYTNASGFTLAASAVRDGRRLVAVVLGAPARMARDTNITALLEAGFNVINRRALGERTTVAANLREPNDFPGFDEPALVEQGSGDQGSRAGAGNRR